MTPRSPTSPIAPDLAQLRAWLEQMVKAMKFVELVVAILAFITRMRDINTELMRQLAHLRRKRPRSETLRRLEKQLLLSFMPHPKPAEKKKKKGGGNGSGGRPGAPAHVPRLETENNVPSEMRICPSCGAEMTTVRHSRCEYIDLIPAKVFIAVRLDETVACPNDDTIVSAPTPPAIVERGKLGDTLIVEAVCDKFLEHLPVERQCTRFARAGVVIAPQTLGRSVCAALDLLAPVAKMIVEKTRGPGFLATDATSIPILDPEAQEGIRTAAMWCWTNAKWVSFFYSRSADSDSVKRFLGKDFKRNVQCDGTATLSFIERAGGKRPGCMSHGRRKFVEAALLGDKVALEALHLIAPLFVVERQATEAGDTAEQRLARRQEHSKPIIENIRAWLDEKRPFFPPKTALGKAIGYMSRQWHRLILFLDDGNVELTNNRRERELRRLVQGRKNWLFAREDIGGQRVADILTILATCIAHDVNPRAYLHLVTKLIVRGWPQSKLRDLLPDQLRRAHSELVLLPSEDELLLDA
jgi:transposase